MVYFYWVITMEKYKKRLVDDMLERKLKGKGAVLIEGPKWSGKTTTAEQISKSILYMANPEEKEQNIALADINPEILLNGETPRLIDEWQLAPKLWDAVRFEVDHRNNEGQFILTGSSVPAKMDEVSHSGIGRIGRLTMRTMSLYESEESNGSVSLKSLFSPNAKISGTNDLSLDDIAYMCCRGGWPRSLFMDKDIALDQAFDYIDSIVKTDITEADGINRNPERTKRLLKSYARNSGSQASSETIKEDMISNDSKALDTDTILSYINALKKIFVIEDVPAWNVECAARGYAAGPAAPRDGGGRVEAPPGGFGAGRRRPVRLPSPASARRSRRRTRGPDPRRR